MFWESIFLAKGFDIGILIKAKDSRVSSIFKVIKSLPTSLNHDCVTVMHCLWSCVLVFTLV